MSIGFFLVGPVSALLMSGISLADTPVTNTAPAADSAPSVYRVAMKLHDGTHLIASPTFDVKLGELATVEIDEGKGQRYLVRLVPTRANGGNVFVVSSIDVASNNATYLASPALMVGLGEASAIELDREGQKSRPFRLDVTLTNTTAPPL